MNDTDDDNERCVLNADVNCKETETQPLFLKKLIINKYKLFLNHLKI